MSEDLLLEITPGDSITGKRSAEYNLRTIGIHVDYALVPTKGLAILPGVGIGFGTQTYSTFQSANNRAWSDYEGVYAPAPDQFSEISRQTLNLLPRLNIEYAFTPFIAIRGQASYTLQLSGNDWTGNRIATVTGVPESVSFDAFNAQVGIFLGLFN